MSIPYSSITTIKFIGRSFPILKNKFNSIVHVVVDFIIVFNHQYSDDLFLISVCKYISVFIM